MTLLAPKGPEHTSPGQSAAPPWVKVAPEDEALKGRNDTETRMSQSLVKNLVHRVYNTKHRKAWIPAEIRDGLYAYQAGILKRWESPVSPFQGLVFVIMITQGGAALCPGLTCSSPFGAREPPWLGTKSTSPERAGYSRASPCLRAYTHRQIRDDMTAEFKR